MNKTNLESLQNVAIIGHIRSPFKEKFGLPRQPGLVTAVNASIEITPEFALPDAFAGLEAFSHIWVNFIFHRSVQQRWKPKVRPPRLGGNQKVGVFASRSPFRPNAIGQSVVALKKIHMRKGIVLEIECPDLVDGTPVIDIKPYLPYCDSLPDAVSGYADAKPLNTLKVEIDPAILPQISECEAHHPGFESLLNQVLSLNPAPAYQSAKQNREYGLRLYDYNIRYCVKGSTAYVISIY